MSWPRISPFYRTLIAIGLALALPTLLVVTIQIHSELQKQKAEVEAAAMSRAVQITALIDARVQADLTALRILADSPLVEVRDWTGFASRARQVLEVIPGWKTLVVWDPQTNQILFDANLPGDGALQAVPQSMRDSVAQGAMDIGGVTRGGPHCPCIYAHAPVTDGLRLTAIVDPQVFQDILQPLTFDNSIAAIVDRKGNFIARSEAFAERVGTPATVYVQGAVAQGGSGIYPGTTFEGLVNYTAYVTSAVSGWSAHMALPATLIDSPGSRSNLTLIGGAASAILVAAAGIAFALANLAASRREEEHRREAQKLEALGRLTGGVAHDFNNLLTVVIGGLGMLLPKQNDPRSRRWAESALEAAQRGAKLTRQLLAFSRGQDMEIRSVNMVALLDGMHDLLRQSLGPDIALEYDIDPVHYWARCDVNQLELAILNLAINARDAMPEGGSLTITVKPAADERIEIDVTDTGEGMSRDVAARAMEPFFTTKPAGSGTGLGLAQVFGAIQQSGGSVRIDSVVGAGTTVCLMLPAAQPPEGDPGEPTDGGAVPCPERTCRVLVVEDEEGVRDIIAETLRANGYTVNEAPNGAAALTLLEAESFDMMVTDFAMNGMNGAELTGQAREIAPELKVLMVSGHADIEAVEAARTNGPLLRKPFTATELLNAVQDALDSPAA